MFLPALERTFRGHLRTSLALAFVSAIISQSYTLSPIPSAPNRPNSLRPGKLLSGLFISWAMVVVLIGAFRFLRVQRFLLKGKIVAGGWDLVTEGAGIASVSDGMALNIVVR